MLQELRPGITGDNTIFAGFWNIPQFEEKRNILICGFKRLVRIVEFGYDETPSMRHASLSLRHCLSQATFRQYGFPSSSTNFQSSSEGCGGIFASS